MKKKLSNRESYSHEWKSPIRKFECGRSSSGKPYMHMEEKLVLTYWRTNRETDKKPIVPSISLVE